MEKFIPEREQRVKQPRAIIEILSDGHLRILPIATSDGEIGVIVEALRRFADQLRDQTDAAEPAN